MIATLLEMLTYARPYGSQAEYDFCSRYIQPLPGAYHDQWGNWHCKIGEAPKVLFSAHTDTVHYQGGRQRVSLIGGIIALASKQKRRNRPSCLGADDTVGVYLMREMILAGVEGYYIFHAGEERGCIGSSALARNHGEWLAKFSAAIAFDRQGTKEVITHQSFGRTCSQVFAWSLAAQLGSAYEPSDRGVYTDTKEYAHLIPECTNISVGYYNQHSADEWIDAEHVEALCSALLDLDTTTLIIDRMPVDDEDDWDLPYSGCVWGGGWAGSANGTRANGTAIPVTTYADRITNFNRDGSIKDTTLLRFDKDDTDCLECGEPLPLGATYCLVCGPDDDIDYTDTDGYCAVCSAPVDPSRSLCYECSDPTQPDDKDVYLAGSEQHLVQAFLRRQAKETRS